MSQAAGAPPPPPPPPPNKKTSFEDLPTELFLYIIQFLRMGDYSQLALAIYPILECHGLVPPLSIETFNRITNPTPPPHLPRRDRRITLDLMPIELIFEIMEYLEPEDRIAFMFSHPEMFGRLFHMLSEETMARLWSVVRWSQQR